jgi:hypothetical protein
MKAMDSVITFSVAITVAGWIAFLTMVLVDLYWRNRR